MTHADLRLWGFRYSVYVRIVRMALAERGLGYDWTEVNPFDPSASNPHPFGRVPMLDHGSVRIFETGAITSYLDTAFPGDSWTPEDPLARARMVQVISLIDSYGYRPMVRQVFASGVFGPATGTPADPAQLAEGLEQSQPVLAAIEGIAQEGHVLGGSLTRADLHLAPMIGYFAAYEPAARMLAGFPALKGWFARIGDRSSYRATDPGLPQNHL